ncbi:MAG: dynamin family protein [Campylobacterales bacterium]|nr:dynamin family protein [Campylobacterales bacterium]
MHNNTIEKIHTDVYELGSFFSLFKKGRLIKEISSSLEIVEKSLKEVPSLKNELTDAKKKHIALNHEFDLHKKSSQKMYSEIEVSFEAYKGESQEEYKKLTESFDVHKKETEENLQNKDKKISSITTNLTNLQSKQLLISKLLSAKLTNEGLEEYKKVLYEDFMNFANKEESLANEAEAILKLQAIEKELEVIIAYPKLHKKNTVAIGGGFSAGKSEFISSFFKSAIKLPIGIEPTTAIPTYVMHTGNDEIIGCSLNGGVVNLKEIDDDFHSKISHNFIKSFDFNLKDIMPLMIFGTQFEHVEHEHICFIDTPGYNPAQTNESYTQDDMHTAKEFLSNASTLIWLIGADANGAISPSDFNFLSDLNLENKKLYVVLNKADVKPESDLKAILEEIVTNLDNYDIEYVGISAFSSIHKKEYAHRKDTLTNFINDCNHESQIHRDIVRKLYDVYLMYKRAILINIKEKKAIKSQIKSISLDILEEGFDDMTNPIFQRLDKLEKIFGTEQQENNLSILENVIKKLKDTIDAVFEHESSIDFDDIRENEIEIDFDFSLDDLELEEDA